MSVTNRPSVDAASVIGWFKAATKKGEALPRTDSKWVAKIVEYIHSYSILIPVSLEKQEVLRLEEFGNKFTVFHRKAREFVRSIDDLISICDDGEFSKDRAIIERLWSTRSSVADEWIDTKEAGIYRKTTWHVWAWEIRSLALCAWNEVDLDRSKINSDNPMTNFLIPALMAIDGNLRDGKGIEAALRGMNNSELLQIEILEARNNKPSWIKT